MGEITHVADFVNILVYFLSCAMGFFLNNSASFKVICIEEKQYKVEKQKITLRFWSISLKSFSLYRVSFLH